MVDRIVREWPVKGVPLPPKLTLTSSQKHLSISDDDTICEFHIYKESYFS